MQFRITTAFDNGRLGDVIGIMQTYFGPDKYTIWQLFKDEKRKILDMIATKSLEELETSLRRTYNRDYPLINALSNNEIPIPNAYRTTFEYILNADLIDSFESDRINIKEIERILAEMEKWNLKIEDASKVSRLAGQSVFKELQRIRSERENLKRIQRLNRLFPLLLKFDIKLQLHQTQNLYFQMSLENKKMGQQEIIPEWLDQFKKLGEHLSIRVA
jgi:hypothetical protein